MKKVLNIDPGDWVLANGGLYVYMFEGGQLRHFFISNANLIKLIEQISLEELRLRVEEDELPF